MVRNDIILGYDGRGKIGIMKKAAVIVNPVAGKMKIKSGILDLLASLGRQDYETAVYVTKARGDASDAAERYGRECDLVVCCGGDGTLNEVISGLLRISEKPLLLYYPCGSTNDFATTLGLPKKIDAAALDIANRKVMELDVGSLNGSRHFSYITSFGIFTKASFSADQKVKNAIGHLAYILQGAKELPDLGKSYHTKVTWDGGSFEGNYALVAVTNSTSAGGVLRLPPEQVKLDDGIFEILLIKGLSNAADTSKTVGMLLRQKYDGENIIMVQTKKAVIECDTAPEWCTDGEFAGNISRAEIECLHGAVRILI